MATEAPVEKTPEETEAYDKKFKFSQVRTNLQGIVDYFRKEVNDTDIRRQERDLEIGDIEEMRESGELKPDDTFIPERVINTNIRREQPDYVNFLTQSQRLLIFNCLSNPDLDTRKLEIDFTRGMTYKGWIKPHVRSVDGSQTHGWDSVEVTFDSTKPLNCGVEQIGHDKLLFPKGTTDIQKCADLLRVYDITPMQARDFIKQYDFSKDVLEAILAKRSGNREHEHLRIYKRWCKFEGAVYVSWFMLDEGAQDWLKEPMKLDLGIAEKSTDELGNETWVPVDIKQYPVFILPYMEGEQDKIESLKGRVYLDGPKQEAKTAILSGYVNGLLRASATYCSPKQDDGNNAHLKQLDMPLENGAILNKPVEFYNAPYPDPAVLQGLNYLDITNQQEAGKIASSVSNRKDSRKTATELSIAKEESAAIASVPIALFSNHVREVYSFAWLIVQSQALQGHIRLLLIPQTNAAGVVEWVNNIEIISQDFECRAAGDVDVIMRAQTINNMQNDLPLMMQTGAANEFIGDLVRLKYPEKGERYAMLIEQGNRQKELIAQLSQLIKSSITSEMLAQMPLEQQQMLAQLDAQVQQELAPPQIAA